MTAISPGMVQSLLSYDPDTGRLSWKERPVSLFSSLRAARSWNAKFAGKEAFTFSDSLGYRQGAILNKGYLAHRVIWAIQTGQWPNMEIDHIDGNGANNSWRNLRVASRAENVQNTRRRSDNSSGTKGVDYQQDRKMWRARIGVNGRSIQIGRFATKEEAARAIAAARADMHGQFARF